MKHLILVIALSTLLFGSGYAQPYQSMFAGTSREWNVWVESEELYGGYPHKPLVRTYTYIGLDSVYLGKTYKQVTTGTFDTLLFREELDSGKVYYIPYCQTAEQIYMDYTLSLGDTFMFQSVKGTVEDKVVDSVYYVAGRKHIRCKLSTPTQYGKTIFIEGVGCYYGFMTYYNDFCSSSRNDIRIKCVYQDGVNIYGGMCSPFITGIKTIREEDISLSPNPVTNLLHISGADKVSNIKLTDMQGRIIQSIPKQQKDVDVSLLPIGMYLLQLQTDDGIRALKFVKH